MAEPITIEVLGSALDLIGRPLMLEALAVVADGKPLPDAAPSGADTGLFLDEFKALRVLGMVESVEGSVAGLYALTPPGRALMDLLDTLAASITRTSTAAYSIS
ncbi:hypothetical protein AB0M46_28765 [Dactylosporangium sp. NPDC051485]|uniref:hypothetical protein n=1 Tax=Dactylosporangium sp. NPDC051485 TaxID=3154846 RepID=UPI0034472770